MFVKFPNIMSLTLSGGGTRNPTLVARITELLPEIRVARAEPTYSAAKEALTMAILANETLSGRAGNVPRATGAARPVVLGEIAL